MYFLLAILLHEEELIAAPLPVASARSLALSVLILIIHSFSPSVRLAMLIVRLLSAEVFSFRPSVCIVTSMILSASIDSCMTFCASVKSLARSLSIRDRVSLYSSCCFCCIINPAACASASTSAISSALSLARFFCT